MWIVKIIHTQIHLFRFVEIGFFVVVAFFFFCQFFLLTQTHLGTYFIHSIFYRYLLFLRFAIFWLLTAFPIISDSVDIIDIIIKCPILFLYKHWKVGKTQLVIIKITVDSINVRIDTTLIHCTIRDKKTYKWKFPIPELSILKKIRTMYIFYILIALVSEVVILSQF